MNAMARLALCLALAPALAAAGRARPREPAADLAAPVPMEAILVEAKPLTSFGLSLQMVAVRQNKQILRMFVRDVVPQSEADYAGLQPGTEILSINGRAVNTFAVGFTPESELGRLFVNRRRGDRILLLIRPPGETDSRSVTLVMGRTQPWSPFNLMDDWAG